MKIAIHHRETGFSSKWIEYCKSNNIEYKIVDCYENDIIRQIDDCNALMWHFTQTNYKDILFAKELIYSLKTAGKKVFPDFYTSWHFDDKVGQKYLLEAIDAPHVRTYIFYDKDKAKEWINKSTFPKVFKLRSGAGSKHVNLVRNKAEANRLVNKAFTTGFSQYNKLTNLKDRWYQYRNGQNTFWNVAKGLLRIIKLPQFAKIIGPEKGYVYFQDFIPSNDSDIRVIVIDDKAFAIKRLVREGDFRASGSGHILYEKHHFNEEIIGISFNIARKIKSQCLALDFVYKEEKPLIVELSYGFVKEGYYKCEGYWDENLDWHQGSFDAQAWMVQSIVKEIRKEELGV